MTARELHLNVNILHSGFSPAAWRMDGSDPRASFDINHYINIAKTAERGTFDAIFLADQAAISDRVDFRPLTSLEPTIVLATVAAHTDRIGLIATASTTYNEPYNIARRFATLDHASNGRIGWNIVTSADLPQSRNFGLTKPVEHSQRYQRAAEFVDIVKALWDSWEDDAFIGDVSTGQFVDVSKVHPIAHNGPHFSVHGPHNIPRPPQGHPVLIQAGGSDDGRELAARHAEAVFSASQSFEEALDYARDLKSRAARLGRSPDGLLVLAGLATIIGSTEEEAKRRQEELWELIPLEYSLTRLSGVLQIDRERLKLDEPLPVDIPLPPDGGHTFFKATLAFARRGNLTVRQLIRALNGSTGHRTIVGTPEAIADDIEAWFRAGAADGFNLMPDVLPSGFDVFVDHVVPILRRRGLFRSHYEGRTLREHLGLARPANPYSTAAAE
ncbi:LLM class flavin-dependent oxidoreductase [Phyllobacterium myrsinacearum]|uniref:FMN-dependent oxidoreductase (Nitrilotriacetate monooxygenase family) n=1 Tax=Phyllobacterium myrsinacearum TaxID=28101 RepID=A0A839EMH4_9HYPH|nr:LLM class flavin-dependent oxidoreductase [Phyllobacterium myrsinacearum]MBA8880042.1 FMN-dependent oxidoreductase (nitrilotriacetate monooxygenase family) [Phyllobacterium myrsinacearum]